MLSGLLWGCSDGASRVSQTVAGPAVSTGTESSTASAMGITPDDAALALTSFSFEDAESQYVVHDHRSDAALVQAAGEALARGVSGPELWAATWIWVNEGFDPAPLLPLLADADASIRVMAATGLIARGRSEGFAPLIDELSNESMLVGQEPPTAAWAAAAESLVRFTGVAANGPPFDADATRRALAQQRWRTWLDDNQASLTFNSVEGQWHTG